MSDLLKDFFEAIAATSFAPATAAALVSITQIQL
jgi:hypothetical protein